MNRDAIPERRVIKLKLSVANAFLIRTDTGGWILVDAGFPDGGRMLLKALNRVGVDPADIILLILTHGHSDHFGGMHIIRTMSGAPTLVHSEEADALRTGISRPVVARSLFFRLVAPLVNSGKPQRRFEPYEPEIVIDDDIPLNEYGVNGRIITTPGHTPGSISIILDDTREAITGDSMFNLFGRRLTLPPVIADPEAARASIRRIEAEQPAILYTGHGGPYGPDDLHALTASLEQ